MTTNHTPKEYRRLKAALKHAAKKNQPTSKLMSKLETIQTLQLYTQN